MTAAVIGRQTIIGSIAESWFNILVGFGVNFTANWFLLPLFGFASLTLDKNIEIGLLYTIISLVRSFVIRRAMNRLKWGHH